MYVPIWLSGESAPATGYRDILNGIKIVLKRPERLPVGPDGRSTLYVPLSVPLPMSLRDKTTKRESWGSEARKLWNSK